MIKTILCSAFLMLVAGISSPGFAGDPEAVHLQIENLLGDADGFAEAFSRLQDAMQAEDSQSVADMTEYPITIKYNGKKYTMKSADQFVENFDGLVSRKIRDSVINQDYGDLFVNSEGVMFGNGEVWMHAVCEDSGCSSSYWAISAFNN